MSKNNWIALQQEFLKANRVTGITAKQWCEEKGLNYQSARRYIKLGAQKNAQSTKVVRLAQDAQNCADDNCDKSDKKKLPKSVNFQDEPNGRDSRGRFTQGNPGNPHPENAFESGNQVARKHGAYSRILKADDLFIAVEDATLDDELIFTRARVVSVTKTLQKIIEDLEQADSVEVRMGLYASMVKTEEILDRLTGRIESIERTLCNMKTGKVQRPRLVADTARIEAATAKLKVETEKLTSENKEVSTQLSDVITELRKEKQDGLL